MKIKTYSHTDGRRTLIEFIQDTSIRTAKVIYVKEDSFLGNHYHKKKEDIFFLVKGSGTYTLDGKQELFKAGDTVLVKPGVKHTFYLIKDSILLEASTTPYDKEDEYEKI